MAVWAGKCPVYGYLRKPSLIDYPGELAAVFFLAGCNFRCGFCHNASLLARQPNTLSWEKVQNVCIAFQEEWVTAAVITGGEPTYSPALVDLVKLLKGFGLKVKLDTNGSHPETIEQLLPMVDYISMDLKCPPAKYPELTGFTETERIIRSVHLIAERAADYEFRTTVIGTYHTDEDMLEIAKLLGGAKRYVLQPFVPRVDLPSDRFTESDRTSEARLSEIRQLIAGCAQEIAIYGSSAPAEKRS